MKSSLAIAIFLASELLAAAPTQAQAPGTTGPTPTAAVPLDGGASLLLAQAAPAGVIIRATTTPPLVAERPGEG